MRKSKHNLHCRVVFCTEPVTREVYEGQLKDKDIAGATVLDCENETHRHYSNGVLVKLHDSREVRGTA